MAEHDYDIANLQPDDLYNLLPFVVRAGDPGLIRHFFMALAYQHNFIAGKLRSTPRHQDPFQAAAFAPSDFGEDVTLFEEWQFLKRLRFPTADQTSRITELERLVPASIQAQDRETKVLRALSQSVGEIVQNGLPVFALRPLIATAIQRGQIKGSPGSFQLLGRILGIFELKAQELWVRHALSNPANPASPDNDGDFATEPEERPYWPADNAYNGNMVTQWPPGSESYNPFVFDDDAAVKTIRYDFLSLDVRSKRYYNTVLNGGTNPFIRLEGTVTAKLQAGLYLLTGGTSTQKARVVVPFIDGSGSITFTAADAGVHGNSITCTVQDHTSGAQHIIIDGPQSKIKYKSSWFDLIIGVDVDLFYSIAAAIPVTEVDAATSFDAALSRTPPDYPVTGTGVGTPIKSDPNIHFQMDLEAFNDTMTILREMVERIRPMSRKIRKRKVGLVLNDALKYAPYCAVLEVILQSPNGSLWSLFLDPASGQPGWALTESGTATTVHQIDRATGALVEWKISDSGLFSTVVSTANLHDQIVLIKGSTSVRGGFIWVNNGHLTAGGVFPQITEAIHGDGTPTEALLSLDYTHVSETPSKHALPFMSDEAQYDGVVPDCLRFQQAPEDELTARRTLLDFDKFHVAAHMGVEDRLDGDLNANWWYDMDGQINGTDLRLRAAGIDTSAIEPVPSGMLTYGYPLQFLNYHGEYIYRDRVTNVAKVASYTYDAPDENTGATLVVDNLADTTEGDGEGPTEGGPEPSGWNSLDSLDAGLWDENTISPWMRHNHFEVRPTGTFTNISDSGGKARLDGFVSTELLPGQSVRIEGGGTFAGFRTLCTTGASTTLTASYAVGGSNGRVWLRHGPFRTEGVDDFILKVTSAAGEGVLNYTLWKSLSGTPSIIDSGTLEGDRTYQATYTAIEADELWVETTGDLSGAVDVSFTTYPPALVRDGFHMLRGGERDDLVYFIVEVGEDWWEYSEGGLDPTDGGVWRGGTWHGTLNGTYTSRGAGMPAVLTFS